VNFSSIMMSALLASSGVMTMGALYRQIGQFNCPNAAFVNVFDLKTTKNSIKHPVLVPTSFGAFSSGSVYFIDNPSGFLKDTKSETPEQVDGFKWPNIVVPVPESVAPNAVLVADGFLVPGKSTGGLYIISAPDGDFGAVSPVKISTDKNGWFYHNATFIDMNNDGHLDVMSARAQKGIFSSGGELLWLENPGTSNGQWTEHVIVQGPDVIFQVTEIDGDPNTVDVVAAQFFSSKLSAYFINKAQPTKGTAVDIDTGLGQAYSVNVVDINADGKLDLLVTTHENGPKSAVYAYEIPSNVKNGTWTRHTLADASNFKVTEGGFNQDAPGFAYAFYPNLKGNNKKPYILVAGDGSQTAYLMSPKSADFDYSIEKIISVNGVIGSIGIGDIDNDGYVEFFVPNYDKSTVYAYTFSPAQTVSMQQ